MVFISPDHKALFLGGGVPGTWPGGGGWLNSHKKEPKKSNGNQKLCPSLEDRNPKSMHRNTKCRWHRKHHVLVFMGVEPKIGVVPQNGWFIIDLGVPLFLKGLVLSYLLGDASKNGVRFSFFGRLNFHGVWKWC